MRYLVFGDVHGNAPALSAVLADAGRRGYDAAIFLGDLIGYYPYPAEALDMVRSLQPFVALRGNHDDLLLALAAGADPAGANEDPLVVEVVGRHLELLDEADRAYLGSLAMEARHDGWAASHGGFRRPFDYLLTVAEAQEQLEHLPAPVGLIGHTHLPRAHVSVTQGEERLWRMIDFGDAQRSYRVPPRATAFLNPGSVGQPRDGNPLAAYALFDAPRRHFEVHRVAYDVASVAQRTRRVGYPERLATRLLEGR
jgi:predicted phosphodiesterase